MKVLLIHNFYRSSSPSGEDVVYRNEVALLRSKEVAIMQYERHNDRISGTLNRAKTVFDSVWSKETYQEVSELIAKEKPDIAHFHNIWYLISPSAYYACKDAGVPVVQTLHNFRTFCANGLLMRGGEVCEECVGKMPWRSVAYGCYRNSRLYSVPVAITEAFHKMRRTWTDKIDAYIALTEFGKQKFVQCGLPEEKIFVKPNFLANPPSVVTSSQRYAVFIGRLSQEKGLNVLFDALRILSSSHPRIFLSFSLKIVGDGPLRQQIMGRCADQKMGKLDNAKMGKIELVGRKSHDECMELLSNASFLIMPSLCYENFPMTIREAFACGKPVIASNLGAMASIIKDRETGLLFQPGNPEDLASKIAWMLGNKDACIQMGRNAKSEFESKYTADRNFDMLMDIYRKAITLSKN